MRKLPIAVILFLFPIFVLAQPTIRGVLKTSKFGYNKGDTLVLKGYNNLYSNAPNTYLIHSKYQTLRTVRPEQITIIDSIDSFWDQQWYTFRSGMIVKKGYDYTIRKELNTACNDYKSNLEFNKILDNDTSVLYYLEDLTSFIFPSKLYKNANYKLNIHIINTSVPDIFSFDNGTIFISSGKIAACRSEEALVRLITNEIGHIICDDQLVKRRKQKNANTAGCILLGAAAVAAVVVVAANMPDNNTASENYYHDMYTTGVIVAGSGYIPKAFDYAPPEYKFNYTDQQNAITATITNRYIKNVWGKNENLSDDEFTGLIARTLTQTAWDLFFKMDYKASLSYINRLENANAAISDDYLLKAKIYRKLYNTDEASYEALKYLKIAREKNSQVNIEIVKEEGLVYYQLKDMTNANARFIEYKSALKQIGENTSRDRDELKWVNEMIQKTQN